MSNNNSIVILKQDKGRDVVKINRSAYLEKCFTLLNTSQFNKLTEDPTHATERKIQRVSPKIKLKVPSNIYSKIYPTGKFYGTAKSTNCNQKILSTNYHLDPLHKKRHCS